MSGELVSEKEGVRKYVMEEASVRMCVRGRIPFFS